jgi:hypothetical protein
LLCLIQTPHDEHALKPAGKHVGLVDHPDTLHHVGVPVHLARDELEVYGVSFGPPRKTDRGPTTMNWSILPAAQKNDVLNFYDMID